MASRLVTLVVLCVALFAGHLSAQQAAAPDSMPTLTAEQNADFTAARQSFAAGKWAEALAKLRPLHEALPSDTRLAKFTAEAAINTGDGNYAQSILKLIAATTPEDWQARILLARTFAEAQQDAARDEALRQLTELHANTADPAFRQHGPILIERDVTPAGHLDFFYSLQPWSRYNVYVMARVYNAEGKQVQRITLESSDLDQPLWAKQHPDLAAKGERMFSMDGYTEQPPAQPGAPATQTHFTYGLFDGRPAYNTVRDGMLAIANGTGAPVLSSTSGIVTK